MAKKVDNLKVETTVQTNGGDQEEENCYVRITGLLCKVALGAPMTELRQLVASSFPTDPDEGKKFLDFLNRLKSAAESAVTVGQEVYAARQNR